MSDGIFIVRDDNTLVEMRASRERKSG